MTYDDWKALGLNSGAAFAEFDTIGFASYSVQFHIGHTTGFAVMGNRHLTRRLLGTFTNKEEANLVALTLRMVK